MVGPEVGRFSGGLANRGDDICVDEVTRAWKFADVSGWRTDNELRVECANISVGKFLPALRAGLLEQIQDLLLSSFSFLLSSFFRDICIKSYVTLVLSNRFDSNNF